MESRRSGLVHTWDAPRRCFQYSFIPRYNETLEITELPFGSINPPTPGNRLKLEDLPPEVAAEINMSMGHAGMQYYTLTWWERRLADVRAWGENANTRRKIWIAQLQILRNSIRIAGIKIKYVVKAVPFRLRLARNWLKLRWLDLKVWFIDALLGEDR